MQSAAPSRRTFKVAGAVVFAVALIPFPTATVPEWRVQYIDGRGRPVVGLPIEQTWQNYSVESRANVVTRHTDAQGYVVFPARSTWSPLLFRAVGPVLNVLSTGVHASFGPSSWLIPKCDVTGSNAMAVYTGSKELPTTIVLKHFDRSAIRAAIPARDLLPIPAECAAIEAQVKG
jgi:hypothetical protein